MKLQEEKNRNVLFSNQVGSLNFSTSLCTPPPFSPPLSWSLYSSIASFCVSSCTFLYVIILYSLTPSNRVRVIKRVKKINSTKIHLTFERDLSILLFKGSNNDISLNYSLMVSTKHYDKNWIISVNCEKYKFRFVTIPIFNYLSRSFTKIHGTNTSLLSKSLVFIIHDNKLPSSMSYNLLTPLFYVTFFILLYNTPHRRNFSWD